MAVAQTVTPTKMSGSVLVACLPAATGCCRSSTRPSRSAAADSEDFSVSDMATEKLTWTKKATEARAKFSALLLRHSL
ncbi:hypothetical protein MPTK1_6g15760 [Marchantia polymorpha subsp. ruderalis]|uniref:Uncharacterized protein n=2 Tax=Marchantia polymorpha TaxID=3197 RepID=A0AAF6BSH0_MARPO|nr:hypothetical protein MARPO_0056s0088 [Marchantia polymorpha]BBN14954.1 hypothetical protein Mp_6g15760 [Marchantia polymorpha subsp. ruderalis]|eukprot:PTQ37638.1 hypothetical protein MARPO_0056s0088 [Marchantia polymorpha]